MRHSPNDDRKGAYAMYLGGSSHEAFAIVRVCSDLGFRGEPMTHVF